MDKVKAKKKPLVPKEVKWFSAAMLAVILLMAVAAVLVDLAYG